VRLNGSLLGKIDISPAGEQVGLVPVTFTVTIQNECIHAMLLFRHKAKDCEFGNPKSLFFVPSWRTKFILAV
jgi:hypothetical protein